MASGRPGLWECKFGGSHLADRVLVEPDDATPNGRFASFADFFQTVPGLRQKVVPE
jgi:hypothetical protein